MSLVTTFKNGVSVNVAKHYTLSKFPWYMTLMIDYPFMEPDFTVRSGGFFIAYVQSV